MSPTHHAAAECPQMCEAPWAKGAAEVAAELGVDVRAGLDDAEVARRQERFGFNELRKEPGKPMWRLVLEQFDDMLVKVSLRGRWGVSFFLSVFLGGCVRASAGIPSL